VGSNPITRSKLEKTSVLLEELPLKELLLLVVGDNIRRQILLRTKSNDELFHLYKSELALRIRNERNLTRYYQVLDDFRASLGEFPPSAQLGKQFLGKWARSRPATLRKYYGIIRDFLRWYGEELNLKISVPHNLPEYVREADIEKMLNVISNKRSHKQTILRDTLVIELAYKSGLRRKELANLKVEDFLPKERYLIVRHGKGDKDRTVPLPLIIAQKLADFVTDKKPGSSVFVLSPASISDKIHRCAQKAGVKIHAHSLRHGYATRLLEKGANVKAVQELLGHSRLDTTESYLSLLPNHLVQAVDLLDEPVEDKRQDQEEAHRPPDSETLKAATNYTANEMLDRETFRNSDSILNERKLRDFLLGLELHHSYRLSEYLKVVRFWEYFELEGNKYTDPEARQLLDNLWYILDDLVIYLRLEFEQGEKSKKKKDSEFRLSPSGLRYLRDDETKVERIAEAESQLDKLINATRESYKDYRAGIRNRLHV